MSVKPVVKCHLLLPLDYLHVGASAIVTAIDHPNHKPGHAVTKDHSVRTSEIQSIDIEARRFETRNTIYEWEPA